MKLKIFTARSMAEALSLVKAEYGSDGVVLHTRSYKRGGLLGVGARTVVEVTAAHGQDIGRQRRRAPRRPQAPPRSTLEPVAPAAGDLIRRTYAAAKAEMTKTAPPTLLVPSIASDSGQEQLAVELRAVKRMVGHMIKNQNHRHREGASGDLPDELFDQYLALLEQEVSEELVREIIDQVRERLDDDALSDDEARRLAMRESIAALIPTDDSAQSPTRCADGRPRTIALVGPTGVGKTTTIAKLAATFKLKQNKRVGLVTADTYRIAAVDQLRTYASIIGVPLEVVTDTGELERAMATLSHNDVVLIDTAGRSQRDDQRLDELAVLLRAAQPHDVHLVLSSTCTQAVLLEAVERFSRIRTDSIIFTKLDEAVTFGVLLNVARKVNKRLSYVTTGQEVPHQIEPGRAEHLADLVMGEARVNATDVSPMEVKQGSGRGDSQRAREVKQ